MTEFTEYAEGDRVRVVLEGVVEVFPNGHGERFVSSAGYTLSLDTLQRYFENFSVEKLAPAWHSAQVIRASVGGPTGLFLKSPYGWINPAGGRCRTPALRDVEVVVP